MTSIYTYMIISSPRYIQKGYIQKRYINQNIQKNISNSNISNDISKVYNPIGSLVGYRLLRAYMLNKSYPVPNQLNNGGLYK